MRVACAAACLLAAPTATAFHVAVPAALPHGGFASAARGAPAGGRAAHRYATTSRMLGGGGAQAEGARARRLSTLLSASAAVAGSSDAVGRIESLRGGGGELVAPKPEKSKLFQAYETGARWFTNLFPIWLCVFSGVALKDPAVFAWFTTE